MLKRFAAVAALALCLGGLASPAFAGSPHFVGTPTATISGDTVTVSAKEAGLGDEAQINVVLTGTAQCVNPGDNDPQAGNKQTFSTSAAVPVQNGKADYTLTLTAVLQPSCNPPMSIQWSGLTLTDTTNNLTVTL
jgi:hypothetical protein